MLSDKDVVRRAGRGLLERIDKTMEAVDWSDFLALANLVREVKRTFVTGAGRSGLVARSFGMRLMHAGLLAYIPGETVTPAAEAGDLLVAISCTGETGYTEYLARRAKELGAKVVVLTAEPGSPLTAVADQVVCIPAAAEDIVLRAGVFEHSASLCLDAVFNVLSERLEVGERDFKRRHANAC